METSSSVQVRAMMQTYHPRQECKEMNQKGNESRMSSSVFYTVAEVGKYLLYSTSGGKAMSLLCTHISVVGSK